MSSAPRRRFKMRQQLISIGDDYDIEDDTGARFAHIDGKALRVRETLILKDDAGAERYTIKDKLLRVRKTMGISRGGDEVAQVQRAMTAPLRERFSISLKGQKDMSAKGNILDHEYTLEQGGEQVAQVSKAWFSLRDAYGVEIHGDHDPFLILAIAACIDSLSHDKDD